MVVSTSCCLNLSPPPPTPTPTPSSLPSRTTQVPWPKKERTWTSQCVLGVTCMLISLEMGNPMGYQERSIAVDIQLIAPSNLGIKKWSDKRMCPPWRLNSLETIVPENLPRPSARRRWEGVDYSTVAPAIKVVVKGDPKCFSM